MALRFFVAIRHASDPDAFYSEHWARNFYPPLRRLGVELVESRVDLEPASRFMAVPVPSVRSDLETRARITEQIVSEIRIEHRKRPVDLVLSYFYNAHFDPAGFPLIHALGIPTVNFFCNSTHQFELVADIARSATFAWHTERGATAKYLSVGARPVHVQMGADPSVYHPVESVERRPGAFFVGQRYADRDRWLAGLVEAGVPVTLYGHGWPGDQGQVVMPDARQGVIRAGRRLRTAGRLITTYVRRSGPIAGVRRMRTEVMYRSESRRLDPILSAVWAGTLSFPEMRRSFSEYAAALNFSNVWSDGRPGSGLVPHVRLRDFEGPMCGACYFTGHFPEILELYRPDREILTYRDHEELASKVAFYIRNPTLADEIRQAGRARALSDHTWEMRFRELLSKLGFKAPFDSRTGPR